MMSNITYFPSNVDYPELDVTALRLASRHANSSTIDVKRLFIQSDYLPMLHAGVARVDNALRDADFKLREAVQTLDTKVGINVRTLRGYQKELDGAPDSDREEILEDIDQRINGIVDIVSKHQTVLNTLFSPLGETVDRNVTTRHLVQLAEDKERLPGDIQGIEERQAELEQKRRDLSEAIALIESKDFVEVGKETLLDAKALAALAKGGPEAAALEKAIEMAQDILKQLESFLNFLDLVEARNVVRKQIDDLVEHHTKKMNELRLVGLKEDLINASHAFDEHRMDYVGEFEKIMRSSRSFLSVHKKVAAENDGAVNQFIVDVEALAKHVKVFG
jgi:hypothetical protein